MSMDCKCKPEGNGIMRIDIACPQHGKPDVNKSSDSVAIKPEDVKVCPCHCHELDKLGNPVLNCQHNTTCEHCKKPEPKECKCPIHIWHDHCIKLDCECKPETNGSDHAIDFTIKSDEWEKRFDELETSAYPPEGHEEVKSFIRELLEQQKVEYEGELVRLRTYWGKRIEDKLAEQKVSILERVRLEKKTNYNQTKKDRCEYCGVLEGASCKDGCEAMAERYYNQAVDELEKKLGEIED
jgi:hypothetical protein